MPKQGDIVLYQRKKLVDGKTAIVSVPATVLSVITEESYNGPNGEPALNLAFFDESRSAQLATTDWRNAFDRATGVKHASHGDLADGKETQAYVEACEIEEFPPFQPPAQQAATPVNTPPAENQQIAGEGDEGDAPQTETIPSMPAVELTEGMVPESVTVEAPQAGTDTTAASAS